jgi:hypothetical protein
MCEQKLRHEPFEAGAGDRVCAAHLVKRVVLADLTQGNRPWEEPGRSKRNPSVFDLEAVYSRSANEAGLTFRRGERLPSVTLLKAAENRKRL